MTVRRDHHAIKALSQCYGPTIASTIQNLPFFHITEEIEKKFTSPLLLNEEGQRRQLPKYTIKLNDYEEVEILLPFKSFTIWIDGIGYFIIQYSIDKSKPSWLVSNIIDKQLAKLMAVKMPTTQLDGVVLNQHLEIYNRNPNGDTEGKIKFDYAQTPDEKRNKELAEVLSELNIDTKLKLDQFKATLQIIEFILSFFKWAEYENRFLMKHRTPTTPKDIKSVKKKPWLRTDVNHYVYLNQFPSDHSKSSSKRGSGSSKRGHNRRAHWRYLKADCYKQTKGKRIRVKESWVGPTETTYHGSTYTVLLEGEKDDY